MSSTGYDACALRREAPSAPLRGGTELATLLDVADWRGTKQVLASGMTRTDGRLSRRQAPKEDPPMKRAGLLETMASGDLEAVTRAVSRGYRSGSVERLAAHDPAWREALDRAEREVGLLYAALCEADATLDRWREAVGELHQLWARVNQAPADEAPVLEEVA